jgi:hypothetical protein
MRQTRSMPRSTNRVLAASRREHVRTETFARLIE